MLWQPNHKNSYFQGQNNLEKEEEMNGCYHSSDEEELQTRNYFN
jgi:hypothetical protein